MFDSTSWQICDGTPQNLPRTFNIHHHTMFIVTGFYVAPPAPAGAGAPTPPYRRPAYPPAPASPSALTRGIRVYNRHHQGHGHDGGRPTAAATTAGAGAAGTYDSASDGDSDSDSEFSASAGDSEFSGFSSNIRARGSSKALYILQGMEIERAGAGAVALGGARPAAAGGAGARKWGWWIRRSAWGFF